MRHRLVGRGAVAGVALLVSVGACARGPQGSEQSAAGQAAAAAEGRASMSTPTGQTGDWRPLFDGATTNGWRGYKRPDMPSGWRVVDGALTRVGQGGDIITADQFANFELELEWKVAPRGNSGIMYRVIEGPDNTYQSGPEMQVLDDAGHVDGTTRLTAAGALYGLYPARPGVVKPAGEWNVARIVANGPHVEHWLNGVKMVDAELGSPEWERLVAGSKFREWPTFGRAKSGHIALQDHGDWVAYRNIKIKVLP